MFFIKRDVYKSFAKLTVGISRLINLQYRTPLGTAFRKNHVTYNLLRFAKKFSILRDCLHQRRHCISQTKRKFYFRLQNQLPFDHHCKHQKSYN